MKYWYQAPAELLKDCVRTILIIEGFSSGQGRNLPMFTNGMPALYLRTERDSSGHDQVKDFSLYGKSIPQHCFEINENTTVMAYLFKPFSLATVFNIPAVALADPQVNLADTDAPAIKKMLSQLAACLLTSLKKELLDNFLLQLLEKNQKVFERIQFATDRIMCTPDTEILAQTAIELKLSERSFQRIFKKYVGTTPSQYRRICQFQYAFTQLRENNFEKFTDIAFDNGFADQSHFIRSFKEFANTTPHLYLREGLKPKTR